MADFNTALKITLRYEGGYSNAKADSGGMTFAGISRNNNPNWRGWPFISAYIKDKGLKHIDTDLLTNAGLMAMVASYYKVNYWDLNRLSDIQNQQLANIVFDFGVNAGTGRAAKYLQTAAGVTADGIIGNGTLTAVNSKEPISLYNAFNMLRKAKYDLIVKNDPTQKQFYASWMGRIKPYIT